ncbi:MAG: HAMP domain-containing histidine kinase [Lachnospiraceae bacterium]|nr:HAMP domain-containing histidine kinase [Lachnospiraceae bacterium]
MDKIAALRAFIIKNFIIILLIVAATENIAVLLLNNLIFPGLSPFIFGKKNIVDYDVFSVLGFFAYCILQGCFVFASRYFPIGLTDIDQKVVEKLRIFKGNVLVERYEALDWRVKAIMIVSILIIIAILVMPILIGGSVFTARVVKHFDDLEKEEKEKQALYERKRNLMLSDIAHDLRTPITTIYGYSQAILDNKATPEKTEEYLKLISMKSKKVDELINLLFDYVKMDSEGFTLHKEKCNLSELVRQAGALLYQDIYDAGMELDADIPEEEIVIDADKVQFSRVVVNLLSNAIKHNPPKTRVGLFLFGDARFPRIYVADNGPSISPEMAIEIFEPFTTGDESRKSSGGSGLGLSIARKISALHGFELTLLQEDKVPSRVKEGGYTKCFAIK